MDVALNVTGKCVYSDEALYENIRAAMLRGLPEILQASPAREGSIAIVGSGPSVQSQIEKLKEIRAVGIPIVAVRDAHDWLIANGLIPDFALSVDPLPSAAECFSRPRTEVHYLLASQSHPKMFDYLSGMNVGLWHCYMRKGQTHPANRMLIAGGTTSGLRAISVFYVLGWRNFLLFGLDSCMDGEMLRITGEGTKPNDPITEVRVEPGGKPFYCNAAMALQAQHFQDYYDQMPDASFQAFGHGLIQAIIEKRDRDDIELQRMIGQPDNGRVSFIHRGGPSMASYRYRAVIPARELGGAVNDLTASTLVFAKIQPQELMEMGKAKLRGQRVIVDFCDDHFAWPHYQEALRLADEVTCSTSVLAEIIRNVPRFAKEAAVISDPYEFPQMPPHFMKPKSDRLPRLLWYGHAVNRSSLQRLTEILESNYPLRHYPFHVVSNCEGTIPWDHETMLAEFAWADIVLMPKTEDYKSANRTVEAIRQGCYVVAEPHPSIMEIPGIWIGGIKEGIEWALQNRLKASQNISEAQTYVETVYSPQIQTAAWKQVIQRLTTSGVETNIGTAG